DITTCLGSDQSVTRTGSAVLIGAVGLANGGGRHADPDVLCRSCYGRSPPAAPAAARLGCWQVFVRFPVYCTPTGHFRGQVSATVHFKAYRRECARHYLLR